MSPRLRLITAALALTLPATLSACGSDEGAGGHGDHAASPSPDGPSVAASEDHNGADIMFATRMIPHHAQALVMTDLTADRTLTPEFQELVDAILAAQGPEINTMTGWLLEWGQPVPATARDHENAHGDHASGDASATPEDTTHDDMPGMMSAEEMSDLGAASDAEFEDLWLEMMIAHHRGAVEMAETEVTDGKHPAATELAQAIIDGQEAEIETMQSMIDAD